MHKVSVAQPFLFILEMCNLCTCRVEEIFQFELVRLYSLLSVLVLISLEYLARASPGFFPGWVRGVYFRFSRWGVGDQIFDNLYGQNKKIAEPGGGQPTPPDPPCRRP